MYLTSHRVVSPSGRQEGINSFFYSHGSLSWQQLPSQFIDQNPGTLVARNVSVPPPENRIRSYLDIVSPDETPWPDIWNRLNLFIHMHQRSAMPWSGPIENCYFRIGMELSLAKQWRHELAVLYRSSQALHLAQTPSQSS